MKTINLSIQKKSFISSLVIHLIMVCTLHIVCSKSYKPVGRSPRVSLKLIVLSEKHIKKPLIKANSLPGSISGLPELKQRSFNKKKNLSIHRKEVLHTASHIPGLRKRRVFAKVSKTDSPRTIASPYPQSKHNSQMRTSDYNKTRKPFTKKRIITKGKAPLPAQLVYKKQAETSYEEKAVEISATEQKRIWDSFKNKVFEKIEKNKRRPRWPGKNRLVIKVKVFFELNRDGTVENIKLLTPEQL